MLNLCSFHVADYNTYTIMTYCIYKTNKKENCFTCIHRLLRNMRINFTVQCLF